MVHKYKIFFFQDPDEAVDDGPEFESDDEFAPRAILRPQRLLKNENSKLPNFLSTPNATSAQRKNESLRKLNFSPIKPLLDSDEETSENSG